MERRYPVFRISVKVLRVLGWIAFAAGAVTLVVGLVMIATVGAAQGLMVALLGVLYGALVGWGCFLYAEALSMAMDIEEHTRGTRAAVEALRAPQSEPAE
jgi:hypothetical protein